MRMLNGTATLDNNLAGLQMVKQNYHMTLQFHSEVYTQGINK